MPDINNFPISKSIEPIANRDKKIPSKMTEETKKERTTEIERAQFLGVRSLMTIESTPCRVAIIFVIIIIIMYCYISIAIPTSGLLPFLIPCACEYEVIKDYIIL